MSTNDPIYCFNGNPAEEKGECIYTACTQFNEQLDTCNFKIIGLLGTVEGGKPITQTRTSPAPVAKDRGRPAPQQPQEPRGEGSLGKIKAGDYVRNITVTILEQPVIKTVTAQGEEKDIMEITVTDGYENAKLTVWPPLTEGIAGRPNGTVLHLEALGSKEYSGQLQLSTTRKTAISYGD